MKKVLTSVLLTFVMGLAITNGSNILADENSKNESYSLLQSTIPSQRAIITSIWGSAPVTFDKSTGVLSVDAGELASRPSSEYLDNNDLIKKTEVTKIIFSNNVVAPINSRYLFSALKYSQAFTNLTSFEGNLDTSQVTNMAYMFSFAVKLTSLDIDDWDVSNVIIASGIFSNMYQLTSLDIGSWNTENAEFMDYMFSGASSLTSLDINGWNTSNVTDMTGMFNRTNQLKSLDISNWDTGNVMSMGFMFNETSSLTSLDISRWNVSKVIVMGSMFSKTGLESLDVSLWNTSNVEYMEAMFSYINLSALNLSNWNLANTKSTDFMFLYSNISSLDLSNWDTSNILYMYQMFEASNFRELILGKKTLFNTTLQGVEVNLPAIDTSSEKYTGKWERVNPSSPLSIYDSSTDFMENYDGSMPGTYVWQGVRFTINYALNGGTNDENNPVEYAYGTGVTGFKDPTRDGYKFIGWVDESGAPITDISTVQLGSKTLYAKWDAQEYTIAYELEGGINSTDNPTTYTVGTGVLKLEEATKEGYTFLGWYPAENIHDTVAVTSILASDFGDKVLYAQWEKNIIPIILPIDEVDGTSTVMDKEEPSVLPQTGVNDTSIFMIILSGLLISGGALIIKRKEES